MDIKTSIGEIVFDSPIFNASGPRCTEKKELLELLFSDSGAIITKSCTLDPREGNPEPRYWDNDSLSINSMGLPNRGYKYYIESMKQLNYYLNKKPFIFSIAGLNCDDNITIINAVHDTINKRNITSSIGIEINLSCPNIIGEGQLAYNFLYMDTYLNKLFNNVDISLLKIIGVKLPPYFELHQFKIVADIIKKYPINFITSINSIGNGLVIDIEKEKQVIAPNNGIGGLGGSIVKQTALSNVYNFAKEFIDTDIKIIGCGGIETGSDVFEYILAGACAVQVGTQFYREDVKCFYRIKNELIELMKNKKYTTLNDFYGQLGLNDVFI